VETTQIYLEVAPIPWKISDMIWDDWGDVCYYTFSRCRSAYCMRASCEFHHNVMHGIDSHSVTSTHALDTWS